LGVKYRIIKSSAFNAGASLSTGIITNSEIKRIGIGVTTYIVQPKLFVELDVNPINKLHPFIGIGYSFLFFDAFRTTNDGINVDEDDTVNKGLNINGGLIYDLTKRTFIQFQYDLISLQAENVPDTKFNTKIQILKLGTGIRFE